MATVPAAAARTAEPFLPRISTPRLRVVICNTGCSCKPYWLMTSPLSGMHLGPVTGVVTATCGFFTTFSSFSGLPPLPFLALAAFSFLLRSSSAFFAASISFLRFSSSFLMRACIVFWLRSNSCSAFFCMFLSCLSERSIFSWPLIWVTRPFSSWALRLRILFKSSKCPCSVFFISSRSSIMRESISTCSRSSLRMWCTQYTCLSGLPFCERRLYKTRASL